MVVAVRDTSVTASATVTTPTARGCERGADGDDIRRQMFGRSADGTSADSRSISP